MLTKKVQLIESVVYACITVSTTVVDATVYGSAQRAIECLDFEILIAQGQLIMSLLSLIEQFEQFWA